jgi:hypothetical protein
MTHPGSRGCQPTALPETLDPAPDARLVAPILTAEATLQIALLALDHPTLHHDEHAGQEHGRPERIRENRHPGVQECEREIDRIAAEGLEPRSHDRCWAINSRIRDARGGRREQRKIREV